jgi:periplasmic protein CpxP/Spy
MKHILVSAALAFTLTGTIAHAQSAAPSTAPSTDPSATTPTSRHHHQHHQRDPQREAAFVGKKLNLSADTQARLEPIFADRDQKMAALWGNTSLTPDERHQQMRTIHQDTKTQLSTVLSAEQIDQLKAMRHRHGGWRQQPQSNPQSNPQSTPQAAPTGL